MDRAQRGATDIMGTIPSVAAGDEARRVFVGEGVALSGRVNTTGTLVVGGEAKVDLPRGALEVLPTGRFEGEATVERAVIAGHFEGTLRVDGDLMLAETARVRGLIRYRRLEVAQGGEIAGDVDTLSDIPEGREVSEAPEAPEGQRVAGDASAETGGIESEASARSAGRQG
jgi:cytoskeletal protein CcmA (bactofilin family)